MRTLPLIALGLLWGSSVRAQPAVRTSGADTRRIDLKAEPAVTPAEIHISPGLATLLLFDSPLERAGTTLERREHFREVDVGERTIVLLPSAIVHDKDQFLLTVHFADGEAPGTALFILKAHPALAERQVEVYRHAQSCDASLQQAREQQAALDECREQLSRCAAGPHVPDSLWELLSSGVVGGNGIQVRHLALPTEGPGPFIVLNGRSYRSTSRVAVEVTLQLKNLEGAPVWVAAGAKLTNRHGDVVEARAVSQAAPVDSEGETHVWVEAELQDFSLPYTLTISEKNGTRTLSVDNVRFP